MICAKRYNVAHRISMLKQRGRGTVGRPRKYYGESLECFYFTWQEYTLRFTIQKINM